jgi:nickel-dependent lactate racemase
MANEPAPPPADFGHVDLPEGWVIRQTATPALRPAPENWTERLARSLSRPDSGPPLGELLRQHRDGSICLLVEDITRHSPVEDLLSVLLKEFRHAGVGEDRVDLLFATGMHPPMTADQAAEKLGRWRDRLAWRSNPWSDPRAYTRVGRVGSLDVDLDRRAADADLRIVLSSVSPHLQAGFGGGWKMFLPGAASLETIRTLHRLGIGRMPRQLVGTGPDRNAMRSAIDAGGRLLDRRHGRTVAVQYLLDERDLPSYIVTGDPDLTQASLTKQCSVACGVLVPNPADVLLVDAAPRDFDLWQSFKGVANTRYAARPGGVIICRSRCPAGYHGMSPPRWGLSPAWTRRVIRTLGPETLGSLLPRLVPALAGDAAFFVRLALRAIHRNPILMVSPTLHEQGSFPGLAICPELDQALQTARRIVGPGPQRVVAFPRAGVTYPVPQAPQRST